MTYNVFGRKLSLNQSTMRDHKAVVNKKAHNDNV